MTTAMMMRTMLEMTMMIKMMSICCNSIYKNMELAQQKICDLTEKKEFKSCNKDHDDGHNGDEYEDIIVPINELDADE